MTPAPAILIVMEIALAIEVEMRTRRFLERFDLPQPDRVEYGHGCIRLFYTEPRVVLVVDVEEAMDQDGEPATDAP